MTLKFLFWNIWLENQLRGIERQKALIVEIRLIINEYKPDCIGLNEVLKHSDHEIPLIHSFLEEQGYLHNYFSHGSPFTKDWDIGSALYSKFPIKFVEEVELGRNATAEKKGHTNNPVKAIAAKLDVIGFDIGVIVAHPINIKPSTFRDHFVHTRNLANFIKTSEFTSNTVIGGDFNEPMYFPRSFKRRTSKQLHHKTGSMRNPTWRHNTWRKTPIRANLDKLFWTKNNILELQEFKLIESHVSDHRPIYASYHLKSSQE
jgi:endonuclease/exonuclease/phosphatase family metal-dependent hydrolase